MPQPRGRRLAVSRMKRARDLGQHGVDTPGFWLPMSALLGDVRGTWAVYQVSQDDKGEFHLRKRSVQPLYQYRGRVYVQAELNNGDQLVEAGTHRLAPGQKVTLWQGEESVDAE